MDGFNLLAPPDRSHRQAMPRRSAMMRPTEAGARPT